jgi:hypothetical protein
MKASMRQHRIKVSIRATFFNLILHGDQSKHFRIALFKFPGKNTRKEMNQEAAIAPYHMIPLVFQKLQLHWLPRG